MTVLTDIILLLADIAELAKMDRILSQPGGSLLLVGRSGVGRRTCTNLVAFMHRMDIFIPSISRRYMLPAEANGYGEW